MPDSTTVVQPPLLATHHSHYLFSDYYLNNVLPTRPEWRAPDVQSEADAALSALAALWKAYTPQGDNEAQTEEDFIRPVLRALGHTYAVQVTLQTPLKARRPDYILSPSVDAANGIKGRTVTEADPVSTTVCSRQRRTCAAIASPAANERATASWAVGLW